jgi:AcrR family transcriptional regulator
MARRSDHSREEIIAMAVSWIKEQLRSGSIGQLSLRQVAKAIGYSPGTLINQFGSYSMLLLHVNAQTLDELSKSMEWAVSEVKQPKAKLLAMANAYLNFALENPNAWRLIFEHRLDETETLPDWQMSRINQLFERVKTELASINTQSNEQSLEEAARVIWSGVHGISFLAIEDKLFQPMNLAHEQLIESLIENYLHGWLNNPPAKQ